MKAVTLRRVKANKGSPGWSISVNVCCGTCERRTGTGIRGVVEVRLCEEWNDYPR
jgi:hypothetical protein